MDDAVSIPGGGRVKVGLALGSGAARAWCHIGVIQALRESDIPIDVVAGTSMGALVGAVHVTGHIDDLHEAALNLNWKSMLYYFFEASVPRSGLVDGKRVMKFLREHIEDQEIQDLPLPFRCTATDLLTGEPVVLDRGNLIDAIRTSISIPGIFTPMVIDGRTLVDGGVTNPIPVDVARDMGADVVIAVDAYHGVLKKAERSLPGHRLDRFKERAGNRYVTALVERISQVKLPAVGPFKHWLQSDPKPNMIDVLGNSVRIMEIQIGAAQMAVHPPDLLLQPSVGSLNMMDFDKAEGAIEAGYEETIRRLPEIRQLTAYS